jgi:NAD(P)-dependent dehydrogenase (short-subunit alcohol dehydrogenase family)
MSDVVVVTGASAGVGRAAARRFAEAGASVALLARNENRLHAAAREVEHAGGRALVHSLDVADADAVEVAAARIEDELGPIDVWVNNAMATIFARLRDISADEFRRSTEVTYLGVVWGTMTALRRMVPRDRGTIVQVGSALAYRGIPLQAPYCGAKHAIQGFTESVRTELLHDGSNVRVTMVQLPAHNTPQFSWGRNRMPKRPQPVPPIYQPEVAAEATRSPRAWSTATSRAPASRRSRPTSPSGRGPTTSSRAWTGTTAPTAVSTTARTAAACCSTPSSRSSGQGEQAVNGLRRPLASP